jgi:hypothetical protein
VFREQEDQQLRALVLGQGGDIGDPVDWDAIAQDLGVGFTPSQVMDRWYHHVRPEFVRTEFTPSERREALRLAVGDYGNWPWIATQIGDGTSRSAVQVKHVVGGLVTRLRRLGLKLDGSEDVDSLPDAFFQRLLIANAEEAIRCYFTAAQAARK